MAPGPAVQGLISLGVNKDPARISHIPASREPAQQYLPRGSSSLGGLGLNGGKVTRSNPGFDTRLLKMASHFLICEMGAIILSSDLLKGL